MSLLAGILHCTCPSNPHYPNFLSKENPSFTSFHVTLDNLLKIHHNDVVGADSVQSKYQLKKRIHYGKLVFSM